MDKIDCSHGNSKKDPKKQALACQDVAMQIRQKNRNIVGVMMESNLVAGTQKLIPGAQLVYGQSVTDPCMAWGETLELLRALAGAIQSRGLVNP